MKKALRFSPLVVGVVLVLLAAGRPASGQGTLLFQDDFNDGDDVGWLVVEGTWTVVDGAYVGPDPGGWNLVAKSIAGEDWWDDYTFEGRFMREAGAHEATLLFRVQWVLPGVNNGKFYQLANGSTGVSLAETFGSPGGANIINLKSVSYSLDADTWYDFRVVLSGPSMEYYIDNNLVMTYGQLTSYSTGKIGLKTAHVGRAHFDDLCVYSGTAACAPAVGGIAEVLVQGGEAPARTGVGSGSAALLYAALAGGTAAATFALAAGGWYARRRWLR